MDSRGPSQLASYLKDMQPAVLSVFLYWWVAEVPHEMAMPLGSKGHHAVSIAAR